jgi:unsaturated pyranuronate lyase
MPFIDTRDLKARQPLPGWEGRFLHSDHMTFAYYTIADGASIHEHSHPQEEVWHVLEGELEVTIGDETRIAGPGCVAVVPAHVRHSVRALRRGRAIVVDTPLREEIGAARTD